MPHDDFYIVYSGNIVQADLLKCLLEAEGIAARLRPCGEVRSHRTNRQQQGGDDKSKASRSPLRLAEV